MINLHWVLIATYDVNWSINSAFALFSSICSKLQNIFSRKKLSSTVFFLVEKKKPLAVIKWERHIFKLKGDRNSFHFVDYFSGCRN